MDPALQRIVIEKLEAEEKAAAEAAAAPRKKGRPATPRPSGWDYLVLAALEGKETLAKMLETPAAGSGRAPLPPPPEPPEVPGIFARQIRVRGFRGIGPEARLDLNPGPGLTLIVGRNGSGKSSFAEALELLLTGNTFRWVQRTAVWREGWRNLHQGTGACIAADFAVEGEAAGLTVSRAFPDSARLTDEGETRVTRPGRQAQSFEELGWSSALAAWRPFLSYSELGSTFDAPSELHDRLAQILGLEELAEAQKLLATERLARRKALDEAERGRKALLEALAGHPDLRATRVRVELEGESWGLEEIESLLGSAASRLQTDLSALHQLAAVRGPSAEAVAAAVAGLCDADERLRNAAGTLAARSLALAELLDGALRFHETQGDGPCPVCGRDGALDAEWHRAKAVEAAGLREAARGASEARDAGRRALATARGLLAGLPVAAFASASQFGLDVAPLMARFEEWNAALALGEPGASADPLGQLSTCAQALESAAGPLREAFLALSSAASAHLSQAEDAWRPMAQRLFEWLPVARRARETAAPLASIETAEGWLGEQGKALRSERFAPIAQRAIAIWAQLRLQSNVELKDVVLEGSATKRRVELKVAVDGADSVALGVMSQGEIHALALSLFLPRATQPESPFRFLVIDDPVQSMDPARVDGLARVLAETARDRQVIVFTHDDRLAESVRRLNLDASIYAVTRQENSRIEVQPNPDPIDRVIADARALARTEGLPPAASRRVVPGLCRHALEAACQKAVRARRIGRGDRHDDVQVLLESNSKLSKLVALALFDDAEKAGEVLPHLNRASRDFADVFKWCNSGAHEEVGGDLMDRIGSSQKLAKWLAGQA
ncbi:MAG: AAA family ATPase [Vicinamibacteria bacterium]|nr:AAA family ATPase [Vicinamibacteria bacterium]